jgi:predicted Zn finger-like uncharacterized protein
MFTVCPKCALTLVVTAADLRVAQGYVRCGRCSNVFNALSRLSEDRQAGAAPAQSSPEPTPAPPPQQRTDATFRTRQASDLTGSRKAVQPPEQDARATHAMHPSGQDARTSHAMPPPPPPEPKRYDDDSAIPEEDLEFNPDATDLNKVFVEPPPSPQFTAATGTFKAIRLEAQDTARAEEELARTDEREVPEHETFDPVDTQVDVEIDPDLLATMAQLTNTRLERLNPTPPESDLSSGPFGEPTPAAPSPPPPPLPPPPTNSTSATATNRALPPPKAASAAKQPLLLQPSMEQPPQLPAPMRLAERAKARAQAARTAVEPARAPEAGSRPDTRKPDNKRQDTRQKADAPKPEPKSKAEDSRETPFETRGSPFETARAIREALAPRNRSIAAGTTAAQQPTSFFAGMWMAGSAVLLLMLVVQVVHHYRHDLAANATLNGPLTSIYAALGIPIVPRWDLGSYEVRQLGASTAAAAPGQITVRASVKNGAHQAQPLPLLRVTLQDRFGNRIASRDVPPQSYLPRAIPSSSLLSAGQRIDAEMAFIDPGSNAVGFEIDACLPAPGGGISCANDTAR